MQYITIQVFLKRFRLLYPSVALPDDKAEKAMDAEDRSYRIPSCYIVVTLWLHYFYTVLPVDILLLYCCDTFVSLFLLTAKRRRRWRVIPYSPPLHRTPCRTAWSLAYRPTGESSVWGAACKLLLQGLGVPPKDFG
jgi:hypothetical protein